MKCLVNLENHVDLGKETCSAWQEEYDSASCMHPPWAGIEKEYKEFCVKSSGCFVVTSIIFNNIEVLKEHDLSFKEAQEEVKKIVISFAVVSVVILLCIVNRFFFIPL